MYQDLTSEAESGFRRLPPWAAGDITADDKDAPKATTETAVVTLERKTSSESQSESSESTDSDESFPAARLEVDADILTLFKVDPAEAVARWRDLYLHRARCGTNKDLWCTTRAAAALAEAQLTAGHLDRDMFRRIIEVGGDFFAFIEEVVTQFDFFDEYPVSLNLASHRDLELTLDLRSRTL